jgi:hypothetical protein
MSFVEFMLAALCGVGAVILLRRTARKESRMQTYPLSHVAFDHSLSDADRLKLLDEARSAVLDGRLSQTNQLEDNRAADKAAKPGAELEN